MAKSRRSRLRSRRRRHTADALGYLITTGVSTPGTGTTAIRFGTPISVDTLAVAGPHNGNQDFQNLVVLDANTTITAGDATPNATFEQTVDSVAADNFTLAINDPGTTWFEGNVGVTGVNDHAGKHHDRHRDDEIRHRGDPHREDHRQPDVYG